MQRMNYACLASTTALTTLMSLGMVQAGTTVEQMTDLYTLGGDESQASVISADGSVIAGRADTGDGGTHAFSWDNTPSSVTDLGTLGGGYSYPRAISANGKVIVGTADVNDTVNHAVSWVNGSTTATDLGTLGGGSSYAYDVSDDGNVIVGASSTSSSGTHAVSWVNGSTTGIDLGTLGGSDSSADAVSADGNTIIGYARTDGGEYHAALWAGGRTTAQDLGTLGGNYSAARAVSANGRVVVGQANTSAGLGHAVSWLDGGSGIDLGTLGGLDSYANDVSADGSVIVGDAQWVNGDYRGAVWMNGSTSATQLGTLGGTESYARAVSSDGSVIIGKAATDSGDMHAAAWAKGSTHATDLGTLGGNSSMAYAVSADGSLIVGSADTASGDSHGFIVKLGFAIQDNQNLIDSFFSLANDTAVAVAGQQAALGGLLGTGCVATAGAKSCFADGSDMLRIATDGSVGRQGAVVAQISAGHAFSPSLTAGISLGLGRARQNGSAFGDSTKTAVNLWSNYSQDGSFSIGLMAHAAIGAAQGTETINRGLGFDNVAVATGTADLSTRAVQASLSYGVQAQGGWLLTPTAGLTWMETRRGAYSETAGVFPASFDKLTTQSSYATLGLGVQRPIDARSNLSLGAGADMDLGADHISLSGTSDLPGMTSFSVTDSLSRNTLRPYVVAGYSYNLSVHSSLGASLRVATAVYGDTPQVNLGVRYALSF